MSDVNLEKGIIMAKAVLSASDSLLSLVYHRYRSMLPEDLAEDIHQTYQDARKAAERLECLQEAWGLDGLPGAGVDD